MRAFGDIMDVESMITRSRRYFPQHPQRQRPFIPHFSNRTCMLSLPVRTTSPVPASPTGYPNAENNSTLEQRSHAL